MKRGTEDLDFFIGDEALAAAGGAGYGINYPIRHGQIDNWVGNVWGRERNAY
jgi:actin-related protein 3